MSYSRRQLEAFGEMLGECVTRKEGGRTIYGGGGGGAPASQTQVSDLPDWAKGYAQKTLAGAEALTFQKDDKGNITGLKPYEQYTGERSAQFTPLQQQAFQSAEALGPSAANYAAQNAAMAATQGALNTGYNPMFARNQYQGTAPYQAGQFQNQFQAPDQYQPGQFGVQQVAGPQLQQYQMGPAQQVRADTFGGRQAAQYMSPYMEQAMAPQLREAQRASEMQRNMDQANAVKQGAFGGSRQALIEAERQRNLGTQLGDIRARGLQSAYEQAQNQFNQDAARRLQAQQLNQQAGLTTGQQNLAAQLGVQQLGAQTGMQAQLAEQSRQFGAGQGLSAAQLQAQYGLSADQASEASRQFAANQAAQQAANRAQYGQAAQQLTEQSRQYGAGLGLQGLQTALQGAGQLGSLGGQEFGQRKEALGLQNQFGTQQQQQVQNILSQQYQDFLNQQKYPYQQLEYMSNLIRGTPTGQVQTMYGAQPSAANQLLGAGTSLAGAYMMGGGRFAEGGEVDAGAGAGLADLAISKM
jgi:hypothetical protein